MAGPFIYYCGHHIGDWTKRSVITVYKGQNLSGEELNKIHSSTFSGLTGPFKTKRAAEWFKNNPGAIGSIVDFEMIAKEEENEVKQKRRVKSKTNHTFMNGFTRKFDELTAWRFTKSIFDTMVKRKLESRGTFRYVTIRGICSATDYMSACGLISSEMEAKMDFQVNRYGPIKSKPYKWPISVYGHKQRSEFCQKMIDKILQSKND